MTDTKHQLDKIKNTFDRANARMEAAVEGIIKLREERDALRELNLELVKALGRIAWQGEYRPTEAELDGEDALHYHQILGRWDAGEEARAALKHAEEVLK